MNTTTIQPRQTVALRANFVLHWRFRSTHPWNREEFSSRSHAYNRFFHLLERGIETRIEAGR